MRVDHITNRSTTGDYMSDTTATETAQTPGLRAVIIRAAASGVHFGYFKEKRGDEVDLVRARRIHYWSGANSCSGLALHGLNLKKSRVAEPVTITVLGVIEIIDCTPEAVINLEQATWAV
jgi:hypothetical protein